MKHRHSRTKIVLVAITLILLAISFYLAYLSGRAMNDAVGDTFESLELSTLSAWVGFPAMVLGVSLVVAEQNGGGFLRITKLIVTFACWFFLQVLACVLIQSFSAP